MSLGKLLTTGKSLVGLNDTTSRYQLRKGALPRFESAKNPFAARTHREPSPSEVEPGEALSKLTPAEIAAARLKETQRFPGPGVNLAAVEQHSPSSKPDRGAVGGAISALLAGWVKKLNPLVWWERSKPTMVKPAVPRFSKTPVQGELSLENIKVMRNDLSEADVEVAPAKSRPDPMPQVSGPSAAAMAMPELPSARRAWEFLGERLLGKP